MLPGGCVGGWQIKDEGDEERNMSLVLGMMIE